MSVRVWVALLGWWGSLSLSAVAASTPGAVLTNASQILALPAESAYGVPVRVCGVVTAAQPDAEWGGRFFVQDSTAGIFVENIGTNQPRPGDLVEIAGLSHPGGYAPIITQPRWRKIGSAPLPAARVVPIEQLMAGIEDSQRVEISGIVRAYRARGAGMVFEIASGGYRLDVSTPPLAGIDPEQLIGARVRVRGTAATFYSGTLRHLITVTLHLPDAADFMVEQEAPGDPFQHPIIPLDRLAQYRKDHDLGRRVHVKGTVTLQRPGQDLFLQDETGGMRIKTHQLQRVSPGDVVEVVGFPSFEQFLPVLEDGVFRLTAEPRRVPAAKPATYLELQGRWRHADLVTLKGRVLDHLVQSVINPNRSLAGHRTVLTLQSSDFLFNVEGPVAQGVSPALPVRAGSVVEVTGVCLMNIAEDGKLLGLRLLLPTAGHLRVLERPTWWTAQRLVLGLAGSVAVLAAALSWIVMVSRKNAMLKVLVSEKEQAQIGLEYANERLEERVRERSEQLNLQISARKETELQFNAVLNERTRLAQELHDTLEQTLTGIALQMDTAARFAGSDPARAAHHLELARNLVTQSQSEVRCSVWDLRSRSPGQIDLAGLLVKISSQLTEDTGIEVQVRAAGRVRPLPESIEENLLRVAQEALTNIIKHSKANQATITLDYGPHNIIMTITDNGHGFDQARQAGPRQGHFGLLGITERTHRLQGQLAIVSEPGKGTTVRAKVPIPAPSSGGVLTGQEAVSL